MTARQLLDILKENPNDHEKFARKSRIEEIVEGATAAIDYSLYGKIIERATVLLDNDFALSMNPKGNDNTTNLLSNGTRCRGSVSLGLNAN